MQTNPFEFEAALRFTPAEMVDYFIDNNNFARFINSQRNVFLLGDRGTGKTMMLRYYSLPVQAWKNARDSESAASRPELQHLGIYIPCRNPAVTKREPELMEARQNALLMSEHFLVTAVIYAIAESLASVGNLLSSSEERIVRDEIKYLFQWEIADTLPLFEALRSAATRESVAIQRELNRRFLDVYYENAVTFSNAIIPFLDLVTNNVDRLRNAHFSLMFDDADALSNLQNEILNSWIASRNSPKISFKVATSLVDQKPLTTAGGGSLLERHDFIRVDMEADFQSSDTTFHKLATDIVERRLEKAGLLGVSASAFFPINTAMQHDLDAAEAKTRTIAGTVYADGTEKQIRDYVYKYKRAYYFRDRSPKANRPPYSGFDLIVHVSTGVLRYLLEPCYEMYDAAQSRLPKDNVQVAVIPPSIQTEILADLSKRRWAWIREGFNNSVRGCNRSDSIRIANLVENFALLLTHRLHHHRSEPRAITFFVSAKESFERTQELLDLLEIARRAQILFKRPGSGKDFGKREDYYIFDRLLWIDRGLDPVGQNASISIEARSLWEAAFENRAFPGAVFEKSKRKRKDAAQVELFDPEVYE